MPRCVTNWEQRTLAYQATAGKSMNIHGATERRGGDGAGAGAGGTARTARNDATPNQDPRSHVLANEPTRESAAKTSTRTAIFSSAKHCRQSWINQSAK